MKNLKKILGVALIGMSLLGTTVFAAVDTLSEVPVGSVVAKDKSFDLDYANNPANEEEVRKAFVDADFEIYVRLFSGEYVDNATGKKVEASVIKPTTYKSSEGVKNISGNSSSTDDDFDIIDIQ